MRIYLLKFLDRWLGAALAHLLPRPLTPPPCGPDPQSILIIRPGGIGDAVLLMPAIHALRARFPQAAIDLLAERRNAGAFALCPGIRTVFCYDRPGQLLEVLHRRYAVVVDSEQWHYLSAVIARLVRAPVKIGFATNPRRRLFTNSVAYSHEDYEVNSFLRLLGPLGITGVVAPQAAWLQLPDSARQAAAELLKGTDRGAFVALFPGASLAQKHWAPERFRAVAEWCLARDLRVVVVGGGGERVAGDVIASRLTVLNLVGLTSLEVTAAVLEKATVVVAGDSGVLHIAAGLGCSTVALFGPSSVVKWAPQGHRHIALRPGNCPACSRFGYTPDCPHEARCMLEITVEDVTEAVAGFFCPSA